MLSRLVFILVLIAVCSATSCIKETGIALRPNALDDSTTLAESAYAVVGRVSRQYGLVQRSPAELGLQFDLSICYKRDDENVDVVLCGKSKRGGVHFMLRESMTSHFTPPVDSLRRAVLDSLRRKFGDQAARECKWEFSRDAAQSGC